MTLIRRRKFSVTLGGLVLTALVAVASLIFLTGQGVAAPPEQVCGSGLPSHAELTAALTQARNDDNGGFNLDMWATIVNRDGVVCGVTFTGNDRGDQWPGSRVNAAKRAKAVLALPISTVLVVDSKTCSAIDRALAK